MLRESSRCFAMRLAWGVRAARSARSAVSGSLMRALPNTTMVERTPQSRSASSAFRYSIPKRLARISSRNRNSLSSTASR